MKHGKCSLLNRACLASTNQPANLFDFSRVNDSTITQRLKNMSIVNDIYIATEIPFLLPKRNILSFSIRNIIASSVVKREPTDLWYIFFCKIVLYFVNIERAKFLKDHNCQIRNWKQGYSFPTLFV